MTGIITYRLIETSDPKLDAAAKIACNLWNHYIEPAGNYVIRIETYRKSTSSTTAIAFTPWSRDGVTYGRVKFNRRFLDNWTAKEAAATLVHEIGHTLGFGWARWMALIDTETGEFVADARAQLPALADMRVELQHGDGSRYSHWDEEQFDKELMTPFKDAQSHMLPVTVDVMSLLGHQVKIRLEETASVDHLLDVFAGQSKFRAETIQGIDLDYFEETDISEEFS